MRSVICYHETGYVCWMDDGVIHRTDGPAVIYPTNVNSKDPNSALVYGKKFFLNGEELEQPAYNRALLKLV